MLQTCSHEYFHECFPGQSKQIIYLVHFDFKPFVVFLLIFLSFVVPVYSYWAGHINNSRIFAFFSDRILQKYFLSYTLLFRYQSKYSLLKWYELLILIDFENLDVDLVIGTAQEIKFFFKDFFSKCDQITLNCEFSYICKQNS